MLTYAFTQTEFAHTLTNTLMYAHSYVLTHFLTYTC